MNRKNIPKRHTFSKNSLTFDNLLMKNKPDVLEITDLLVSLATLVVGGIG